MSQNLRNISGNASFNNDFFYNSSILETDSPIVRDRFSRFSRLAESMDQSKFGQSMMANSGNSSSLFGVDSASTPFLNRSASTIANVSEIGSSVAAKPTVYQSPSSIFNSSQTYHNLQGTLQLPVDNSDQPNDSMIEDHQSNESVAHLAIFESFYELNQRFNKPPEIFEMLDQFDQTCEENFLVNQQLLESKVRTDYEMNYYKKLASLLRLERNSWRLLRALLCDRIVNNNNNNGPGTIQDHEEIDEDMNLRLSDHELIERAFERNPQLREMQIVIDWLESVYDEDGPVDKVDFYSDGPNYWENTLYSLKLARTKKDGAVLSKGRQYCQQMDPDASIRSGLPLHDLDKEDENRLLHYIFKLVRSGHLQDGKEVAERLGYFWLSAALEGWILHHDPNYRPETGDNLLEDCDNDDEGLSLHSGSVRSRTVTVKNLQPQIGNPYRDLWKLTAWKCSKMEGTNVYERTIFAIFSGNRSAVMPLCTKWSDKLWAYFKCSLDVHLENLLTDSNIVKPDLQPRNTIELPDAYWDNKLSPGEIFREIETQFTVGGNGIGSGFSFQLEEEYHQTIQKSLILNKIDLLVDHLYEWSKTIQTNRESRIKQNRAQLAAAKSETLFSKQSSKLFQSELLANNCTFSTNNNNNSEEWSKIVEPNLLRFFGHVVIVLKQLQLIDEKHLELCVEILEIYIGYLIEFKLIELVAFYVGFLPEDRQVKMFATLLEDIDDIMDRKLCLVVAKNSKLNLPAITTMVVENIRLGKFSYQSYLKPKSNQNDHHQKSLLTSTITEEDLRKTNALDWLLLDEDHSQYLELLWQTNALIRQFLLEQKLDIAVQTFEKLPTDIVGLVYKEWKVVGSVDELWNIGFDIENVVREYLCYKVFIEAHEAFQKWHHFLYNTKPRQPTKPKQMSRLADRVAYEQAQKQFEQEMIQWNSQIKHQAALTAEKIISFLSFPQCIWVDMDNLDTLQQGCDDGSSVVAGVGGDSDSVMEIGVYPDEVVPIASIDHHIGKPDNSPKTMESVGHALVRSQQQKRKQQEWSQRTAQLDGLRRIYIPQFISLLHSVYSDSGNLTECLRIADLVSDEQRRLYTTLSPDQLKDLLNKLRETSIAILNQCSDPIGYVGN